MDSVKLEKEIAIRRYKRLRHVGVFLRCAEAGAILMLLTWTSARLPAAAKFSGGILKSVISTLTKPPAVFFIGNAIVVLLFSGKLSPNSNSSNSSTSPSPINSNGRVNGGGHDAGSKQSPNSTAGDEIYDVELVESKERIFDWFPEENGIVSAAAGVATGGELVVYEDKQVCIETLRKPRECRRSKSEKLDRKPTKDKTADLRRAESETSTKILAKSNALIGAAAEQEEEDAEEFRRTVEAFIAKQQKFQREESLAAAPHE